MFGTSVMLQTLTSPDYDKNAVLNYVQGDY